MLIGEASEQGRNSARPAAERNQETTDAVWWGGQALRNAQPGAQFL